MIFNLANFNKPDFLKKCQHFLDNILLANGSVTLFNGISTITLIFYNKNSTKKNFFSNIYYCSKFDIKLISLEILD